MISSGNLRPVEPLDKGVKYDQGKTQWRLFPWKAAESIAQVLLYGARKYSPDNWIKVMRGDPDRYFDALMRHLVAWRAGEEIDPESGRPHLSHAGACILFLIWYWHCMDKEEAEKCD